MSCAVCSISTSGRRLRRTRATPTMASTVSTIRLTIRSMLIRCPIVLYTLVTSIAEMM